MNVSGFNSSVSAYRPIFNRLAGGEASAGSSRSEKPDSNAGELSQEDAAQIAKLKQRDREVRQHEMAHLAASGGLATSGASYTYQKGPDGVNYAIGGEVSIDTSPGKTPEETIQRARTISAAALAPADPSGQDRAIAAQAAQLAQQASVELSQQRLEESSSEGKAGSDTKAKVDSYYANEEQPPSLVTTYA
jgi:hypothetical protein